MKNFILDVDFVMSKRIQVEAENEEQAREIARKKMEKYPHYYYAKADALVSYEITDVNEED